MKDIVKSKRFWICSLLMALLLVVSNWIVKYSFDLFGYKILLSVLTFPFIFFVSNVLTKKRGITSTILAIIMSVVVQLLIYLIPSYDVSGTIILGSLVSFTTSVLFNTIVYGKVIKKSNTLAVFLTFTLALVLDLVIFNLIAKIEFGTAFLISTIIRTVIALILVLLSARLDIEPQKN